MDWISPGGRRYRAPYGANNNKNNKVFPEIYSYRKKILLFFSLHLKWVMIHNKDNNNYNNIINNCEQTQYIKDNFDVSRLDCVISVVFSS